LVLDRESKDFKAKDGMEAVFPMHVLDIQVQGVKVLKGIPKISKYHGDHSGWGPRSIAFS
jgi:hypothetical protein